MNGEILAMWKMVFALALSMGTPARAETVELVDGSVEWLAVSTLGVVKIHGTGGKASGKIDITGGKATGTIDCELAPFKTDNDTRDGHLHEKYLESAKWPKATLELDPASAAAEFEWSGKLTVKGETKPVKGKARYTPPDLWAEFKVDLKDFPAIGAPEWKGVHVANEVTVTVKAKTK
jgi:polyisoprenoid-binding protein YceI